MENELIAKWIKKWIIKWNEINEIKMSKSIFHLLVLLSGCHSHLNVTQKCFV